MKEQKGLDQFNLSCVVLHGPCALDCLPCIGTAFEPPKLILSRPIHARNPCRFAFIQEPHLKLPFSDLVNFMVKLAFLGVHTYIHTYLHGDLDSDTDTDTDTEITG